MEMGDPKSKFAEGSINKLPTVGLNSTQLSSTQLNLYVDMSHEEEQEARETNLHSIDMIWAPIQKNPPLCLILKTGC